MIVAVLIIMASVALISFSKMREQQVLKNGLENILASIDTARGETLASLNSSSYGVHFQSNKVIIFKGTVFSVNDSNNQTVAITSPASISNVTLNGVSATSGDIYFVVLSGLPSQSGTVTVSTPSLSKIITISATGVASSN